MKLLPGVPAVLVATVFAAACSSDAATPTQIDAEGPNPSYSLSGPKGYAFRLNNAQKAIATLDGTRSVRCVDSGQGTSSHTLTLTQKMVGEMRSALEGGGSAIIEALTAHTFTGEGEYAYSEDIGVLGGGLAGSIPATGGTFSNSATASSPGRPSQVTNMVFQHPIALAEMDSIVAGGAFSVVAFASAEGELIGTDCGEIKGGQVMWRSWGAVLRLTP
jgi:hypothetical protein